MAGARAGAEIMDKGGTDVGAENKQFRFRNTSKDSDVQFVSERVLRFAKV